MSEQVSIIIPVLNEAGNIQAQLQALQIYRQAGHELIVVDGGSQDGTQQLAEPLCDKLINGPRGRARQMNAGAAHARGDLLLFLHADTSLPAEAIQRITSALDNNPRRVWGRFDVSLSGKQLLLSIVAWLMNLRSRLTGIATGDQAIFVKRDIFEKLAGFPDIPLMEDIRISSLLLKISRPICLTDKVRTSSRRWEQKGIVRTILLMWYLRLAHFLGKSPAELARIYHQ